MTTADHERLAASRIEEAVEATRRLLEPETLTGVGEVAEAMVTGFRGGGKLLAFGNGGSAEAAQHLVGELIGRLRLDRAPLPAVALVDSAAALTAIANDESYARVFARQVEGLGNEGDLAVALSTSGRSENVVAGLAAARERGMTTIALTGPDPSPVGEAADHTLRLPGGETTRIQECHLVVAHILCEIVESELA